MGRNKNIKNEIKIEQENMNRINETAKTKEPTYNSLFLALCSLLFKSEL